MPITDLRRLLLLHTPTPPPFVDLFNRADGAVGNGWRGASWSISGNKITNVLTTVEVALNGGAEGVYVAGLAPNWASVVHTGGRAKEIADVHGGLAAERLTLGVGQREYLGPLPSEAGAGNWYRVSSWIKCVAGDAAFKLRYTTGAAAFIMNAANAAWEQYTDLVKATLNIDGADIDVQTNNSDVIYDDVSQLRLNPSEFYLLRDYAARNVIVGGLVKWVSVDPVHAPTSYALSNQITGFIISADSITSPQNYVIVYHDGGSVYLSKVVSGVETKLITSAAALYHTNLLTGAWMEVRRINDTTYQLFMDGAQVGVNQTITEPNIVKGSIVGVEINNSSTVDVFSVRRYGADYANTKPAAPYYAGSTYPAGNGVLSIRFDDGHWDDFATIFPLLTARGLTAGFAVPRTSIGGAGKPNTAQFLTMQTAGMEIMCHSWMHGADPTTWAEFDYETTAAGDEMRLLGFNIDSWVQPGTWIGAFAIGPAAIGGPLDYHLRASYPSYMAYAIPFDAGGNRYNLPYSTPYGMQPCAGDTQTLAQLNTLLANLIAEGRGATPLFHAANIGSGGGHISWADFTTWLDNVQIAVAGGNLTVLTPTQAMFATPV